MKFRYLGTLLCFVLFVHHSSEQGIPYSGTDDGVVNTESPQNPGLAGNTGIVGSIRNTTNGILKRLEAPRDRVLEFIKPAVQSDFSRNVSRVLDNIWNRVHQTNSSIIRNPLFRNSVVIPINTTLARLREMTRSENEHSELDVSNLEVVNLNQPEGEARFREYLESGGTTDQRASSPSVIFLLRNDTENSSNDPSSTLSNESTENVVTEKVLASESIKDVVTENAPTSESTENVVTENASTNGSTKDVVNENTSTSESTKDVIAEKVLASGSTEDEVIENAPSSSLPDSPEPENVMTNTDPSDDEVSNSTPNDDVTNQPADQVDEVRVQTPAVLVDDTLNPTKSIKKRRTKRFMDENQFIIATARVRNMFDNVRRHNMQECTALALCEAYCRPHKYENTRHMQFRNMFDLFGSFGADHQDHDYYTRAKRYGQRYNGDDCENCRYQYNCQHDREKLLERFHTMDSDRYN